MSCGWFPEIPDFTAKGPFFFNSLVNWKNVPFTWKDYEKPKVPTFGYLLLHFFHDSFFFSPKLDLFFINSRI